MRASLIRAVAVLSTLFWMGCTQTNSESSSNQAGGDVSDDIVQDAGGDAGSVDGTGAGDTTPGTLAIPFAVDDYFIASGYMGAGSVEGGIEAGDDCPSRPADAAGDCHAFTLNPTAENAWGGVWWQYPDGNWGDADIEGRRIAPGAQAVRFHAWSQSGGENVTFEVGMQGIDSFNAGVDLVLTDTPTEYEIYIGHHEYETVIGGFSWTIDSETSVSFFVDNITWSDVAPTELEGCLDPNADNHVPGATIDSGGCVYAVEFAVDMNCSGLDDFENVYVTGTFCDWCDQGYPLSDEDGDGVYQATHAFPAGQYEYTYQVDQYADKEDLTDDVANGNGACAPVNSGPFSAEYANRALTVETMPLSLDGDTYGSCIPCGQDPPAKPEVDVTFQVDMSQVSVENYAGVAVCGVWSGSDLWSCTTMTEVSDGVSSATLALAGNMAYQYTYKWFTDEADTEGYVGEEMLADDSCQVGSGNLNRKVVLEAQDVVLEAACWAQCGDCNVEPPKQVTVTFAVDMQKMDLDEGAGVAVCGSWNDWWPCTKMDVADDSAVYTAVQDFTVGGEFEYVFKTYTDVEDGETYALEPLDAGGAGACQVGDGNSNRALMIEEGLDLKAVCWGLCGPCSDDAEILGCMAAGASNHNPNANVDDGSCLFAVTFHADLSCSSDASSSVHLNGPFNEWCGTCAPMADDDGDGVYTMKLDLPAGDHEFKYVTNGGDWEALDATEDAACTKTTVETDGTYTNRLVTVVDAAVMIPKAQPGSCEPCPAPECGDGACDPGEDEASCAEDCAGVVSGCTNGDATNFDDKATDDDDSCTFKVDFKIHTACAMPEISEGDVVYVMGLDTWGVEPQMAAELSDEDGDGLWEGSWIGKAGDYEYILSFGHWMADAGYWDMWYGKENLAGQACAAESNNRSLTVGGPSTQELVHSACEACPESGEDVPGCTDEAASNFNDKATQDNGSCEYPVTFQVDMSCYGAFEKVFVNGAFNNWCGNCWELSDDDGDSIYTFTADFPLGAVEFKYSVDANWEELNPTDNDACTLTSEDGQFTNRTVIVEGPTTIQAAAPASCDSCGPPECGDGVCNGEETVDTCDADCTAAELAEVSFQVEIGCSTPEFSDGDVVYVMGLDNWGGDQIGIELTDEDKNGVWEGTWKGAPGDYEYILSFGHWMAEEAYWNTWYGKEDLSGQACIAESGNRMLTADGIMDLDLTHSYCEACPGDVEDGKAEVEFAVNLGCSAPELSDGDVVYVMGMDAWDNPDQLAATLSDEDGDGVWEGSWSGDSGSYEYTLSFGHWIADPGYWDMWYGKEDISGQECANPDSANRMIDANGLMQLELNHSHCGACPGEEPAGTEIEFSVDMGCSVPELSEGDAVYVMGMDAWGNPDQLAVELTDEDQDGIWKGIWSGEPGDYEYTLSFGHWEGWWNMWFGHEDISGQGCANPDSGNRVITADGSMQVALTHSYCEGCPGGEPQEAKMEFSVDMGCSNPALSEGDVVYVMGLDKWESPDQIAAELSDEDQDGTWTGTWTGPPGEYAYILSFGHWIAEEQNWSIWYGKEDIGAQACSDEGGNRTVNANGVMELALAHSECSGCSDESNAQPGCKDSEASNTDPQATLDDGSCLYPVTFQVDMNCYPDFQSVFVNGEFNEWCGDCWQMTDEDQDGVYSYKADFPKSGVEFKYSVDGNWEILTPGDECTVTAGEYTNRYVEVTGSTVVAAGAPGSCSGCIN